jgi:hypothetical protein
MKRCTLEDLDFVNSIIRHPDVYPWVSDDNSPPPEQNTLAQMLLGCESVFVLSSNEFTIFVFIPLNSIHFELHTLVLPEGRGKIAIASAKEAGKWIIENTPCQKMKTMVPVFNRAAKWMSRKLGFKYEGTETKSFLKNGILYDQESFGITRKEWLCR